MTQVPQVAKHGARLSFGEEVQPGLYPRHVCLPPVEDNCAAIPHGVLALLQVRTAFDTFAASQNMSSSGLGAGLLAITVLGTLLPAATPCRHRVLGCWQGFRCWPLQRGHRMGLTPMIQRRPGNFGGRLVDSRRKYATKHSQEDKAQMGVSSQALVQCSLRIMDSLEQA